jgi:hypothetical protein
VVVARCQRKVALYPNVSYALGFSLTGASMADLAATVAFGLLIGGQFLGAIYLLSNRSTLYPEDQLSRRRSTIRDAMMSEGGAG